MHSAEPAYPPHYTVKDYGAWAGKWEPIAGHTLCHNPTRPPYQRLGGKLLHHLDEIPECCPSCHHGGRKVAGTAFWFIPTG